MLRFLAERVPFRPYEVMSGPIMEGAPMVTEVIDFALTNTGAT